MSSVDERVVKMSFDNAEFEKKASTTMGTLAKLKEKLNFSGVLKGVDEIQNGVGNIKFDALTNGIAALENRFSVLGEFVHNTFMNIINTAADAGKRIAEALTITPAKEGFAEYELKMGSIQTIMSSTGESLDTVNTKLDELNDYADKTIYSFSDMTSNIGKFTNAGVKLDDAVAAIQGVSNVAAVSGANAQQASHAMYNFAQALSSGSVKLQDWKSIETAQMSTVEFRQALMDTAAAMGTLKKEGDKYVSTTTDLNGKTSDAFDAMQGFNMSLSSQWMTTDVLIQTLGNYSTDVREMSDAEREAYEEKLRGIGYTEEQIAAIEELGKKAADSAKDVKTFSQLIDTLKEGLGTGWAVTWETIIGNFEEGKALWTEVYNTLSEVINKSAESRNELAKSWKELGGREALIQSFRNAYDALLSIVTPLSKAFKSIFPAVTAERLVEYTEKLRDFTAGLKLNKTETVLLTAYARQIFDIVKSGFEAIKTLGGNVFSIIKAIGSGFADAFSSSVLISIKSFVDSFKEFLEVIKPSENVLRNLQSLATGVGSIFRALITVVSNLGTALFNSLGIFFKDSAPDIDHFMNSIGNIGDKLKSFASNIENAFTVDTFAGGLGSIGSALSNLFDIIKSNVDIPSILENIFNFITGIDLSGIAGFFNGILEGANGISDIIHNIFTNLGGENGFFAWIVNGFKSLTSKIDWNLLFNILSHVENFLTVGALLKFVNLIKGLPDALSGVADHIKEIFKLAKGDGGESPITRILNGVGNALERWQKTLKSVSLLAIAGAIALIAHGLMELSQIPVDKILPTFGALAGGIGMLIGAAKLLSKTDITALPDLMVLAWAIDTLAGTIVKLSALDPVQLATGLAGVVALIISLTESLKALSKVDMVNSKDMIVFAGSMLIMSFAIGNLAGAVKKLAKLDPIGLASGLAGVIILMGSLVAAIDHLGSKKIENVGGIVALSAAMILIAQAVGMLSSSVKKLAKLDPLGLVAGLSAVIILMGSLVIVMESMSKIDTSHAAGVVALSAAMILIAKAVGTLASAVKKLAALEPLSMVAGLGAVIILLGSLVATLEYMSKNVKFDNVAGIAALSASMILIAEAVNILAKSVMKMSSLSIGELATGLIGVIVPLGALIAAIQLLSSIDQTKIAGIAALSATMVVMAIAIRLLASSVTTLASLSLGQLAIGLLGLVGSLLAMGAALAMLSALPTTNLFGASAAIMAMAISMAILAPAIVMLSTMDIGGLAIALIALGGAFMLFSTIAAASAITTTALLAFAAAIALVGVGVLALASGIGIISSIISTAGPQAGEAIQTMLQVFIDSIPLIGEAVLSFLTTIFDVIVSFLTEAIPKLFETLTVLVQSVCEFLVTNVPTIINTLLTLLVQLGQAVLQYGPELFSIGIQIITEFLRAIAENMPQILEAAFEMLGAFLEGILQRLPEIIDSAFKVVIEFINGLADAIRENHNALFDAVGNLITAVVEAIIDGVIKIGEAAADWITGPGGVLDSIGGFFQDLFDAGANLVQGFIDGLCSMPGAIWDAACDLGNSVLNAMGITLDEHSPSKKAFEQGKNYGLGFINGIKELSQNAADESGAMASGVLDAMSSTLSDGSSAYSPTISPVIDDSSIENGAEAINSVISGMSDEVTAKLTVGISDNLYNVYQGVLNTNSQLKSMEYQMDRIYDRMDYWLESIEGDTLEMVGRFMRLTDEGTNIYMDTGALVGAIAPEMDNALGMRQIMTERGVY